MSIPPRFKNTIIATPHQYSFLWTIENFTECVRLNAGKLRSPEFYIGSRKPTYLVLHTQGEEKDGCYCIAPGIAGLSVTIHISILIHGELVTPLTIEKDTTNKTCWINLRDIPRSEVFGTKRTFFLPQDIMTLRVRILHPKQRLLTPDKELFARTVIGVGSRSFKWSIKNFSSLSSAEKKIYTLKFSPGLPQVKIQLSLNEMLKTQRSDYVLLEVELKDFDVSNFVKCKICLLDAEGNASKSHRQEYIYNPGSDEHNWSGPAFVEKTRRPLMADKEQLLPNDVLTWRFDVSSIGVISNEFEYEDVSFVPSLPSAADDNRQCVEKYNLGKHLYGLLEQKKFCDATLHVEGKAFEVHKSVLCAMSPVFFAMFERCMVESQTGVVDIPDLDAETMQGLLVYMYTGCVSELQWDNVYKLYYAADKYGILPLKETCSLFMVERLNVNNVCDVLLFGDRHRDSDLKLACLQFIATFDKLIINSDKFKMFEKNNAEIANETWRAIYLKSQSINI